MQKKPDASHHPDGVPAFGASLNRNKPHKAAWIEQAFHTGQETKNMLKSYVTFDPFMPIDPALCRIRLRMLRAGRTVGEEPQPDQPAGRTIPILSMQIIPGCLSIAAR